MDEFGFGLEQVLFKERVCRVCNTKKNLIEDFYLTRKSRKGYPSAYSYECKICTVKRITSKSCLLYTSPSPRDLSTSRMPSSA